MTNEIEQAMDAAASVLGTEGVKQRPTTVEIEHLDYK